MAAVTTSVAIRLRGERLAALWEAVTRWREAVCDTAAGTIDCDDDRCVGDNHAEGCPVELARQDVIAVHNKGLP